MDPGYKYLVQQHPMIVRGRWLLWSTLLCAALLIVWAHYAQLDEVTRGSGQVIPSSEVKQVQSLEGGIIEEILIKEGELVEPEQILMRINDIRFSANYQESRVEYLILLAQTARLRVEAKAEMQFIVPELVLNERPDLAEHQQQLLKARQQEQASSLQILQQQKEQRIEELEELKVKREQARKSYQLAQRELQITEPLVKEKVLSEIELLRLQREVNDLKGSLSAMGIAEKRIKAALSESDARIDEQKKRYQSTILKELAETSARLEQIAETMPALQDRLKRTALRSPVRGIVKTVHVNTVGGVVEPAHALVDIVPLEDSLLVEASIKPADIAFIYPGQKAVVRFTAYDSAIFGGIKAKVDHISADSLTDANGETYYRVLLHTESEFIQRGNEKLPIIPGMVTEIDILTGQKSVLNYLLKPLHRMKQRAFTER